MFSHLYPNVLDDEEKFRGFFTMNIEQFYRLSQWVGEEIQKQNTNGRREIKPEERLFIFLVTSYKSVQETRERFSILLEPHFCLN
jgi:hypothetical protein